MNMKILDTFAKRLKFLMEIKDVTNVDLANRIGQSANSVSSYRTGARKPDIDTLGLIATYLNVNVDFLLMRNDDYTTYVKKEVDGNIVEIQFQDEKLRLTEDEIQDMINKLSKVGFDVKKLL